MNLRSKFWYSVLLIACKRLFPVISVYQTDGYVRALTLAQSEYWLVRSKEPEDG